MGYWSRSSRVVPKAETVSPTAYFTSRKRCGPSVAPGFLRHSLPGQQLLLPVDMREWLPEGDLVYFISDVVDTLDRSAFHAP